MPLMDKSTIIEPNGREQRKNLNCRKQSQKKKNTRNNCKIWVFF